MESSKKLSCHSPKTCDCRRAQGRQGQMGDLGERKVSCGVEKPCLQSQAPCKSKAERTGQSGYYDHNHLQPCIQERAWSRPPQNVQFCRHRGHELASRTLSVQISSVLNLVKTHFWLPQNTHTELSRLARKFSSIVERNQEIPTCFA